MPIETGGRVPFGNALVHGVLLPAAIPPDVCSAAPRAARPKAKVLRQSPALYPPRESIRSLLPTLPDCGILSAAAVSRPPPLPTIDHRLDNLRKRLTRRKFFHPAPVQHRYFRQICIYISSFVQPCHDPYYIALYSPPEEHHAVALRIVFNYCLAPLGLEDVLDPPHVLRLRGVLQTA